MRLAHSRIPGAKQDRLIGSTLTSFPPPILPCFQKPIADSFKPGGADAMVSVIWLERREPVHNPCIFVRGIDGGVEAPYYVAGADIIVADCDRWWLYRLVSHDVLFGMLVGGRNGTVERYWYEW